VAASAADLNVAGVRQYTSSEEQVTSITQFSDVKPTDWAYQALSNLIERYGCVAGYPNGTYKGGQAMTRYEAAALLNACLDRITEVTDELKRLMKEFEKELAVLKGRVDSLEAKVGELEATQFSTTTKLKGIATFMLGSTSFGGTSYGNVPLLSTIPAGWDGTNAGTTANTLVVTDAGVPVSSIPNTAAYNQTTLGATSFNYDLRLSFDTSFTGKDLLRTTLRAGNFGGSSFGTGLSFMEAAFEQNVGGTVGGASADNIVGVNRLFYNFPVGDELSVAAGPIIRVDDPGMLGIWPSAYPADTVLDFFTYAGAPGAYNLVGLGGGAGFVYSPKFAKGLTISQNYVAGNNGVGGNIGNPSAGGVMTIGGPSSAVTQVGYASDKTPFIGGSYAIAFAYTYSQNLGLPVGTPLAGIFSALGVGNSGSNYGLSGYWKPEKAGLVPSISWGFGGGSYNTGRNQGANTATLVPTTGVTTATWYTGLQWDDAFIKGNAAGMAVGQAPFVTNVGPQAANTLAASLPGAGYSKGANDSNYVWEWWYKFQVTDNISVTPALFYISNYAGQLGKKNLNSNGNGHAQNGELNAFGGVLKTTFKF